MSEDGTGMTKHEAILILLRCLSSEPEICPSAEEAVMSQPDMAEIVRLVETVEEGSR